MVGLDGWRSFQSLCVQQLKGYNDRTAGTHFTVGVASLAELVFDLLSS